VAGRLQSWVKSALLEVQEYMRLIGRVFSALVTPPL
jgi:hypothetical protein